jgi:hypothetical protein
MFSFICNTYFSEEAQYAKYAYNCNSADSAVADQYNNNIYNTYAKVDDISSIYATKNELNTAIGDIDSALDAINGESIDGGGNL